MDDKQLTNSWGGASAPSDNGFASDKQKQAAKNLILQDINRIFEDTPSQSKIDVNHIVEQTANRQKNTQESNESPTANIQLPSSYQQNYTDRSAQSSNQNINWENYHKAWQNYYQKYYEYYFKQGQQNIQAQYNQFAEKTYQQYQQDLAAKNEQVSKLNEALEANPNFNPQNAALNDLYNKIRAQAIKQGRRFRKSKHFLPIVATLTVVLVFLFLQFNQIIVGQVMAYVAPGNMSPDSIVIDPTVSVAVSDEPKLIIPVLNIEAPVAYDVPNDNESTLKAMENGLAHYCIPGACAHPGEKGNTVISGHRTNGIYQTGDYKFIFLKLDQLKPGDIIYANYKGKRYTYSVTRSEVVDPSNTQSVITDGKKPTMTLITCTPIGSAAKRLLVHAEQIAPDPNTASKSKSIEASTIKSIPGQTKTFWQELFGSNNNKDN